MHMYEVREVPFDVPLGQNSGQFTPRMHGPAPSEERCVVMMRLLTRAASCAGYGHPVVPVPDGRVTLPGPGPAGREHSWLARRVTASPRQGRGRRETASCAIPRPSSSSSDVCLPGGGGVRFHQTCRFP